MAQGPRKEALVCQGFAARHLIDRVAPSDPLDHSASNPQAAGLARLAMFRRRCPHTLTRRTSSSGCNGPAPAQRGRLSRAGGGVMSKPRAQAHSDTLGEGDDVRFSAAPPRDGRRWLGPKLGPFQRATHAPRTEQCRHQPAIGDHHSC